MILKLKIIEIKYFKFYKEIKIDLINGKNILLYGENGSGKSSLYLALEKLFFSYFRKKTLLATLEKEKNNNFVRHINIKAELTNNKKLSIYYKNQNYHTKKVKGISFNHSIYFLNAESLNHIADKTNLFDSLDTLKSKFSCLDDIFMRIENINMKTEQYNSIGDIDVYEIIDNREQLDNELEIIVESLTGSINNILDHFKDDMQIELQFKASEFSIGAQKAEFIPPKIIVLVNNTTEYKTILHEGKFRILSLAIFFALVNESEKDKSEQSEHIKLLVLDDFLSSLDMGNRMYVMKYIFETYVEYQKIITTHNLTLFNVVKKLINTNRESNKWLFKNIFYKKSRRYYEPAIYDSKDNYLQKAQEEFDRNEFELCGNLIRKELERIVSQVEIKLVTSDREKLSIVVDRIKKKKTYILNSQEVSNKALQMISNIKEHILDNDNLDKTEISNKIKRKFQDFENTKKLNLEKFNNILSDLNFHRDILLNKASHVNDSEHYRKEYEQALLEVQELQKIFNKLKF